MTHPYQKGLEAVSSAAGMEKVAVTLEQLRQATKPITESGLLRRRTLQHESYSRPLTGGWFTSNKGPPHASVLANPPRGKRLFDEAEETFSPVQYVRQDPGRLNREWYIHLENMQRAQQLQINRQNTLGSHIFQRGDIGEHLARHGRTQPLQTPEGKEAFNRFVLLHERAELARQDGTRPFSGHASLRPPLQDLNIAATLTGPGSEAAAGIRTLRHREMKEFYNAVPQAERLDLGNQRISRHARKRLQGLYESAAPVRPSPFIVEGA